MLNEAQIEKIVSAAIVQIQKQSEKSCNTVINTKPEHMTHLKGDCLVGKNHPVIAFRGAVDALEAEIILAQMQAKQQDIMLLYKDLEEIREFVHTLIGCEISGNKAEIRMLCGLTDNEIHERSHHPGKYYGIHHFVPSAVQGEIPAVLNKLRTMARQTELAAYRAFDTKQDTTKCGTNVPEVSRPDIIQVLNRISSLFHVMMVKYLAGEYKGIMIEVEASGRHIHLSREDIDALFGVGYQLTNVRPLSQPGQFVCQERLTIEGPKGRIENVVVLGPERKETQVEISMTDARSLGIEPVVRQSGHVDGTPGCVISSGKAQIHLKQGVIVAGRHMHVSAADASKMHLNDGENVSVKISGARGLVFDHVLVRVSDKFETYMHIDYDEANACGLKKGEMGMIMKETGYREVKS